MAENEIVKNSYISPDKGELEVDIIHDAQPRVCLSLDLGIPNFTVFSMKIPLIEGHGEMAGLIAESVQVLLDEVASFMLSLHFKDEVISKVYAIVSTAYKNVSEKESGNSELPLTTFRIKFDIPQEFIDETQNKVIIATISYEKTIAKLEDLYDEVLEVRYQHVDALFAGTIPDLLPQSKVFLDRAESLISPILHNKQMYLINDITNNNKTLNENWNFVNRYMSAAHRAYVDKLQADVFYYLLCTISASIDTLRVLGGDIKTSSFSAENLFHESCGIRNNLKGLLASKTVLQQDISEYYRKISTLYEKAKVGLAPLLNNTYLDFDDNHTELIARVIKAKLDVCDGYLSRVEPHLVKSKSTPLDQTKINDLGEDLLESVLYLSGALMYKKNYDEVGKKTSASPSKLYSMYCKLNSILDDTNFSSLNKKQREELLKTLYTYYYSMENEIKKENRQQGNLDLGDPSGILLKEYKSYLNRYLKEAREYLDLHHYHGACGKLVSVCGWLVWGKEGHKTSSPKSRFLSNLYSERTALINMEKEIRKVMVYNQIGQAKLPEDRIPEFKKQIEDVYNKIKKFDDNQMFLDIPDKNKISLELVTKCISSGLTVTETNLENNRLMEAISTLIQVYNFLIYLKTIDPTKTAAPKIQRSPKVRHIELTPSPLPKTSPNDVSKIIRQYRNRSLKHQPKPMYVVVYDQFGRPAGTLPLGGSNFKNQLLSLVYKRASLELSSPVSYPDETSLKSGLITGTPSAISVGDMTYELNAFAGSTMALYKGPQDWLVKFPDGRTGVFPGRPTFRNMRRLNFPVPRNRFRWTIVLDNSSENQK